MLALLLSNSMAWISGALREHEAGVDQNVAVAHSDQHAVHADLAQAADRQHSDRWPIGSGRTGELAGGVIAER